MTSVRDLLGFQPPRWILLPGATLPLNDPRQQACEAVACDQCATVAFDQGKGRPFPMCPSHAERYREAWGVALPEGWRGHE